MNFCSRCGREIPDSADFCPSCGAPQRGQSGAEKPPFNVLAIVGLCLSGASILWSFSGILSLAGLIVSILGYRSCRRSGERGRELALAGIILGGIITAASLLLLLVGVGLMHSVWHGIWDMVSYDFF